MLRDLQRLHPDLVTRATEIAFAVRLATSFRAPVEASGRSALAPAAGRPWAVRPRWYNPLMGRGTLAVASVLLVALASGCFASVTGGGYLVDTVEGRKPGFGLGLHLGLYLDLDTVRVAVGGGGDGALASVDGDRHTMGAKGTTVVASYSLLERFLWRGRVTGAYTWGDGYAGFQPDGDSSEHVEYEGQCCGRSIFLGGTFDFPLKKGSLAASLGPHYISSRTDEHGGFAAYGAQLRLTLSTFAGLDGISKIFGAYKYKPPEAQCEEVYNKEYSHYEYRCGDD